jgi:2-keto-4-pentenoate hydratase
MLKQDQIEKAARIIAAARQGDPAPDCLPPAHLPPDCAPGDAVEAQAIQDRLTTLLGEKVVGWKVGPLRDGIVMRGAIYASRTFVGPATLPAGLVRLFGIEVEIAFRIERDLPQSQNGYTREEVARVVTPLAAIEVVDSRFRSYYDAPFLDRAADLMSNGAFIIGTTRPDRDPADLASLEVCLLVNGREIMRTIGGHPSGDPLIPAVDLANHLSKTGTIRAGMVMTTGSFTGLHIAQPGDTILASFTGFGDVGLVLHG